jgi:DNA invertase Pin-like site-specific DNA recombinase
MTKNQNPTAKALLYVRVSTGRQADEGVSLEHQERQLIAQAELLGFERWEIVREEGKSGKNLTGRPALTDALARLDAGEAAALLVYKLDRLSRRAMDVLAICDNANKNGWRLVIMDQSLDTGTPSGRFVLTIMAGFAEMERSRIGERQADVHASRRQTGQVWGVTCGPRTPEAVRTRVLALRANGMTVRAIAQELEAEGIPTARGGNWQASTVAKILKAKAPQPAA